MGKTILVTGKEGFLGSEISQHFLNQGDQVSVGVPPRKDALPLLESNPRLFQFSWTRRSPISAKNFLLQTLQEFETLDEAWILVTPERDPFQLVELAPHALDESLDHAVKGTLYLVRELLQRQATQTNLVIRFVFFDEDPSSMPPLAALYYHGLRAHVTSLLAQARKRSLPVWAYESLIPRTEDYLNYLLYSKTPQPGRWNVLGEKKTLMNTLFSRKETP